MSQSEVIALLREKPSGSRVKLLVERNSIKINSQCSASHDSLMTSVSEIDEEGSTLSKSKVIVNYFFISYTYLYLFPAYR